MKDQLISRKLWIFGARSRILVVALLVGAFAGMLIVTSGCTVVPGRRHRARTVVVADVPGVDVVYVKEAPPKPRVEVRTKKPNAKAIWVPGHWQWNGRKYVWKPGHWDVKPGGKNWVEGHWKRSPRGWTWVPGHWK